MRLLIIGNLSSELTKAIEIAKATKAKITMVESIESALEFILEGKGADLVLIDVHFAVKELVVSFMDQKIAVPIIAYGVQCSAKEAVEAINSGAKEFLPLPPDERLIGAIFASLSNNTASIIGDSESFKKALNMADKVAASSANILITGQSGTGKEVFANYIHNKSLRKDKPFVAVNCAAIPENLLESELFGHEKGAFTGALSRRVGKFEESSGGTLLLDEISEMDIRLQAKLLRAIQEKEIDRVGGTSPVKVDLRIIATSNRDLLQEIKKGHFREDLYFRLNIISIELPSLKEREDDILLLAEYFINKYTNTNNLGVKNLSPEAVSKLKAYHWPGNVRELENIIHRAVLISEGESISSDDIMTYSKQAENLDANFAKDSGRVAGWYSDESKMVFSTIGYCAGDLSKAANILGVSIEILQEKVAKYTSK